MRVFSSSAEYLMDVYRLPFLNPMLDDIFEKIKYSLIFIEHLLNLVYTPGFGAMVYYA